MAIGFNDIGHVVTEVYIGGPSTYTYLPYTPAQGEVTLPLPLIGLSGGSGSVYLNNSDQMVFTTALGVPSFYSAATGLLPLTSLVAADSGWGFIDVYAINNRGQILAEGVNAAAGRTTFVLLTPAGPAAVHLHYGRGRSTSPGHRGRRARAAAMARLHVCCVEQCPAGRWPLLQTVA